jgi:hypothetical protein
LSHAACKQRFNEPITIEPVAKRAISAYHRYVIHSASSHIMKSLGLIAAVLLASAFTMGATHAQTTTPAEPAAKATPEKKVKRARPFTPKSEKAKACSMKADEQNLRGKARKKFRSDCMKTA